MTRRGSGIDERRLGSKYLAPALGARRLYWKREEDPSRGHFIGHSRFTRKRPFDYSVVCEGRAYAIEAKVAHPRLTLRPHQVVFVHAQAELRDDLCDDCWEHLRKTVDRLCRYVEKCRS